MAYIRRTAHLHHTTAKRAAHAGIDLVLQGDQWVATRDTYTATRPHAVDALDAVMRQMWDAGDPAHPNHHLR